MEAITKIKFGKEGIINNFFLYDKLHYYQNIILSPELLIKKIEDTDKHLNEESYITNWKWSDPLAELSIYQEPSHHFAEQKFITKNKKGVVDEELVKINSTIEKALNKVLKEYTKEHYELKYMVICKNRMGKVLGPHTDSSNCIKLSIILYLNNDYEGGEIVFPELDLELKPSPGSALVFPSTQKYTHFSKVITSKPKYTINSFWG